MNLFTLVPLGASVSWPELTSGAYVLSVFNCDYAILEIGTTSSMHPESSTACMDFNG